MRDCLIITRATTIHLIGALVDYRTGKTNALAGGVAAGTAAAMTKSHGHSTSTPKKSTDLTETTRRNRSSSSSSSNDERAAASKSKSKSRSVSRGKGAGFLGAFMGKKEEHDAKKEVKKEENGEATEEIREAKHDTTAEKALEMGEHKHHHGMAVPLVGGAAAGIALDAEAIGYLQHPVAMLTTHQASRVMEAPATEILPTSTESGVVSDATTGPVGTTKGTVTPPKPTKRNSIFGAIFEKVRSPTSEKKEPDFAPAVPPKDVERSTGPPVLPETTTTIEIPAIATASDTRHAVPESSPHVNATTPRKEKESFLGGWMNKARAKSPSATHERKGSAHERRVVASEAPTVPAKFDDPIATAPNGVDKLDIPAEPSTAAATATTPDAVKERRRSSFFGLAAGNNADGKASVSSKFGSIFRRNSQAVRAAKEGQTSSTTTAAAHETAAPAEHVGTDGLLGGGAAAPVAAVRQPGEVAAGDAVDAITPVHAHAGNAGSNAVSASA
ncbi:hypothetical protein LTR66_001386 [Elasticomyces elasticus]|nr:hypothetical protein LTR66_001386 [Elasticomyces elasticus]